MDELFHRLVLDRVEEWMIEADEKLRGTGVRCFVSGANDDFFEIDDALRKSEVIEDPNGRVIDLGDGYELLGMGYGNPTPWPCPRDIPEEQLAARIDEAAAGVKNMDKTIFSLHVPPLGTGLDLAPRLDDELRMVMTAAGPEMIAVGSTATRDAIVKYRPMLGLHGHIHESKGVKKPRRHHGRQPRQRVRRGSPGRPDRRHRPEEGSPRGATSNRLALDQVREALSVAQEINRAMPTPSGVFTRASSGLVRQIRADDVMYYGWQQIALSYIVFIVLAWNFYPGASMEWATIFATVGGVALAVCYALLAAVYPRSGGEYVFVSRVVHPGLGFAVSFSFAFWQIFYYGINGAFLAIYALSPFFAVMGVQTGNSGLLSVSRPGSRTARACSWRAA